MKHTRMHAVTRFLRIAVLIVALLALIMGPVQAQAPGPETNPLGWEDSNKKEYGIHSVGYWDDNVSLMILNAADVRLRWGGWTPRYRLYNQWAWEQDFKKSSLGGVESARVDAVDLALYFGPGSGSGWFGFSDQAHDDGKLTTNDCSRAWGDQDNEWVALYAGGVLADAQVARWANCMAGGHLILGFVTGAAAGQLADQSDSHFAQFAW